MPVYVFFAIRLIAYNDTIGRNMSNLQQETDNIFRFQWHITEKCNLRCSHCYQDNYLSSGELGSEGLKKIADEIISALSKWGKRGDILITGGEPLLKDEAFAIINYLASFSEIARISVLTNGTLINEKIIEMIKTSNKIKDLQVSLDGANPGTHDSIRGNHAFEKAINGIRLLRKNKIDVDVMFTLQRGNAGDVPSLIDLVNAEGIKSLTIERFVPLGRGKKIGKESLSSGELKKIFRYVSNRACQGIEEGSATHISRSRPLWVLTGSSVGGVCSIGLDGMCILPDSTVLPCRRLPIPLGNLKEDRLLTIWHRSKLLWEIADRRNLKGKCHACEFVNRCSGCRAMAFAYTGDYLAEDPQCFK